MDPSPDRSFRPASPLDFPGVAQVVARSFPGLHRSETQWIETFSRTPGFALWVGTQGSQVIAACQLHSLHQWIAGVRLPIAGLGLVSIAPTHRRQGVAANLICSALRHARESGDLASALYPFRASFYAGLGYGRAGRALQYLVPTSDLPDAPERDWIRWVRTSEERAAVEQCYARWAQTQSGQVERDEARWKALWGQDGLLSVLVQAPDGSVQGYMIVRERTELPLATRYLEVVEHASLSSAARRGLLAWLGSLSDQWARILIRTHPEEGFGEIPSEPRLPAGIGEGWGLWYPEAVRLRGPMFRLLHPAQALEARPVVRGTPLTVTLRLVDLQIPENEAPFRMTLEEGRVGIQRAAVYATDATLTLPISVLSRLYIGDLSFSAATKRGLLQVDRPSVIPALDGAFQVPSPWTFDAF